MKMPSSKFTHFCPKTVDLPLAKKRFLDGRQIFFKKLSIESKCPKTLPVTLFRPSKGPGTKIWPTKDEVRVRVKNRIISQDVIST